VTATDIFAPTDAPKTAVHAIDLFVEADCVPTARRGTHGYDTVRLGPVTLYGTTATLEATLAAALDAVRALVAEGAA
jgi:hypothetical protein